MPVTPNNGHMPLPALLLVLCAALLHASWNIAAKRAVDGAGGDRRFTLLTSLMTCAVWLPAGLYFGWAEVPRWSWLQWGASGVSAVGHLLYFDTLLTGYRKADLTVVYPLARGSAPLLTALVAATQVRCAAGNRSVCWTRRATVAWVRSRVEPPAP